ncbi:serine/threonine protein kinase [Minicystis rosea]|nr:serine/threonine protein kinase [Minicystis rosea]
MIAGKYRLLRELAQGGMGAVWVAHHLGLDEDVAIKFMSAALPEPADARARFAREARAAARLRGPHVVQILDHGVDGDMPYLVMELLHGEHLGERLRREGRLSLAATVSIADQMATALSRAHRAGIVHRDLKPANIFLAHDDDDEVVKLLDFGIAKEMGRAIGDVTHTDVLIGSPQYMSPEQARGARDVDPRADLWSFGAILFRAITGSPAFEGSTAVDVIVRICAGAPPLPSQVLPGLPVELDAFFRRALDREPGRRFASAREMADVFAALVGQRDPSVAIGSGPRKVDISREMAPTQVTARIARPSGAQRSESAPPAEDIGAFVDRAFDAMVAFEPSLGDAALMTMRPRAPSSPGLDEPTSSPSLGDAALMTTRPRSPSSPGFDERAVIATGPRAGSDPGLDERASMDGRTQYEPVASGSIAPPRAPLESTDELRAPESTVPVLRRLSVRPRRASAAAPALAVDLRTRPDSEAPSGARWMVTPAPLPSGSLHRGAVAMLIDEGFTALRRGEIDVARRAWEEALSLDPTNRMLALNLRRLDTLGRRSRE